MAHKVDQDTGAVHVATCAHSSGAERLIDGRRWCATCGALSEPIAFGREPAPEDWREPLSAALLRAALRVVVEASEFQARAAAVLDAARGSPADLAAFREGVEGERRRGSPYEAAAYQRVVRTLDPKRVVGISFDPVPSCGLYSGCVLPSGHAGRCLSVVVEPSHVAVGVRREGEPDDHT